MRRASCRGPTAVSNDGLGADYAAGGGEVRQLITVTLLRFVLVAIAAAA